jgi:hypothetical protein
VTNRVIGLQFQNREKWSDDLVRQGRFPAVLLYNPGDKARPWGTYTCARVIKGPDEEDNRLVWKGAEGADEYYRRCLDSYMIAPWVDCWFGPNEPQPMGDPNFRRAFVEFTKRWVKLMHDVGRNVGVGCFGVGWPGGETNIVESIRLSAISVAPIISGLTPRDRIVFHEYFVPGMSLPDGWYTGRYRRTLGWWKEAGYNADSIPVIMGEIGIDGGINTNLNKKGWRDFGITATQYLDKLCEYDDSLSPQVQAAFVFGTNMNQDWATFEYDEDDVGMLLARYVRKETVPVTQPDIVVPPIKYDGRSMSAMEFRDHVAKLPNRNIRFVVLHHTASDPAAWQYGGASLKIMANDFNHRRWQDPATGKWYSGWSAGPHLFVGEKIELFTPLTEDGVGVTNLNTNTWHIEMIGDYDEAYPSNTTLMNTLEAVGILLKKAGMDIGGFRLHRELENTRCPGAKITMAYIGPMINGWLQAHSNYQAEMEKVIRNAAWNTVDNGPGVIIAHDPNSAFYKAARDLDLGAPMRAGWQMVAGGTLVAVMPFALGICYAKVGDWGNVKVIEWYEKE